MLSLVKERRSSLYTVEKIEDAATDALAAPVQVFTRADLSPDQAVVYDQILAWWRDTGKKPYLTVGGLAGTGKSTLVSVLAGELRHDGAAIAFAAYTGKAARVLGRKLQAQGILPDFCGTLHSLLYVPVIHDHDDPRIDCKEQKTCGKRGTVERWETMGLADVYDLIIVDEASMVGADIWNDLLAAGVPILAVGDHGQLPPVGGSAVNLMESPNLRLEKIHRQAEGNPILALAHFVRQGGNLRQFRPTDDRVQFVRVFPPLASVAASFNNVAICYFNKTRVQLNNIVRAHVGRSGPTPDPGDVVVCLKNTGKRLANGMRGVFESLEPDADEFGRFRGTCRFPDDSIRIKGQFQYHQFGRPRTIASLDDLPPPVGGDARYNNWNDVGLLFDFGYALTCHKMQGSQAKEVVVRYETFYKDTEDMRRRWAYTAFTRASERLYVVL